MYIQCFPLALIAGCADQLLYLNDALNMSLMCQTVVTNTLKHGQK